MSTYDDDLETFYAARPQRRDAEEWDHGLYWREVADGANHRVTWLKETGEIYALRLSDAAVRAFDGGVIVDAGVATGAVELLGVVAAAESWPPDRGVQELVKQCGIDGEPAIVQSLPKLRALLAR
ncbi:hypothetical protein GKE82_25990 [Conexibacter sp. W3-3-2]|uniref:hypothetical protein n=1 Tax=Conexibacter sp. W3-3-2 TaxID=2675227 RepID=UPI0012B8AFEF|nr:hypothetical protein [Conexibacter sp. W3-3-2]MTD47656.1 hypothetical protein [Conexibacter sp. W3-3-2]